MAGTLAMVSNTDAQNEQLTATVARERGRLWRFIRARVRDEADAEEILQDVLSELVEAVRLLEPIEQLGAWLLRVARNRIIDRFRRRRPDAALEPGWEELLPALEPGPEGEYVRGLLLDELAVALDELPREQRDVFVAHELEGRSFNEMAAASGVPLSTLLARKRYAVLRLRARLRAFYEDVIGQR
jgi:RNA polymerase sigma factor (sigma-70 family)